MKTVTCNNCRHSFQILESQTLPTCPQCGAMVFLAGEVYVPVQALENVEKWLKERRERDNE